MSFPDCTIKQMEGERVAGFLSRLFREALKGILFAREQATLLCFGIPFKGEPTEENTGMLYVIVVEVVT